MAPKKRKNVHLDPQSDGTAQLANSRVFGQKLSVPRLKIKHFHPVHKDLQSGTVLNALWCKHGGWLFWFFGSLRFRAKTQICSTPFTDSNRFDIQERTCSITTGTQLRTTHASQNNSQPFHPPARESKRLRVPFNCLHPYLVDYAPIAPVYVSEPLPAVEINSSNVWNS